jgi:hypothetical protein
MPTLQDIYAKFGEAAEAAQLLETEQGNLLLSAGIAGHDLVNEPKPELAKDLVNAVNRKTLGQLIRAIDGNGSAPAGLEERLVRALSERNRLNHSFYRKHNLRRNSEEGRTLMLRDLNKIHDCLLEAYKAVLLLSGVDITNMVLLRPPSDHLPILQRILVPSTMNLAPNPSLNADVPRAGLRLRSGPPVSLFR